MNEESVDTIEERPDNPAVERRPPKRPAWRQPESYVAVVSALVLLLGAVVAIGWQSGSGGPERAIAHVGAPAPEFSVAIRDGGSWSLAEYAGRPIWINLWATWCLPCRVEFPEIDELYRAEGTGRLAFIAVNFQESDGAIQAFLEHTGYSFPIGLDPDGEFARRYGIEGLPAHIFIAEDGSVQAVRVGGMSRAEMERQLEELLGRRPTAD